jgi:hypothetical protein
MSIFPADDRYDAIGRVGFTRVGRPKDRKCVRSEGRQYDHRYHHKIVRFHAKFLRAGSISCYDASVGFSDAAEAWIATLSCGGGTNQEAVVRQTPISKPGYLPVLVDCAIGRAMVHRSSAKAQAL